MSRVPALIVVWMCVTPLGSGVSAQSAATASRDPSAQIEKGRQVVAQVCATCHTTIGRMMQVHKQTPDQWKDTVYFMISRGAQIMPDEIEAVTAFLAATAGSRGGPSGPPDPSGTAGSTTQAGSTAQAAGRGRAGGAGSGQQTAAADGAAILQRTCQQCHDLATASKKTASEDWTAIVTRMTTYGARLAPADQQTLIGYLNGLTH